MDEPDERSMMTYVSSLYDVFPEVPSVEHSVRDNVSLHLLNSKQATMLVNMSLSLAE